MTYLYLPGLLALDHVRTTSVGWRSAAARLMLWLGGSDNKHPVHDGQLQAHGNLVAHDEVFNLF